VETPAARFRRSFALACAAGLVLLATLGCGEPADSQATPDVPPEGLVRLIEAMGASDFDAARAELGTLDRDALTRSQQGLVHRLESQLHSVANEYGPALESLERALASGGLSPEEESAARFDKGWLQAQLGRSAQAVEAYEAWEAALTTPATNTQLLTMSEAYAAARDCAGAAALIAKAYARITPEETVEVAAALELAREHCPEEPGLLKYGSLS
jgi:hypothetical protein